MTNSRIIMTLLARALNMGFRRSFPLALRPKMNLYGENDHSERGDVAGWVAVTLLSAVLVAVLLTISGPALEVLFNPAVASVEP